MASLHNSAQEASHTGARWRAGPQVATAIIVRGKSQTDEQEEEEEEEDGGRSNAGVWWTIGSIPYATLEAA